MPRPRSGHRQRLSGRHAVPTRASTACPPTSCRSGHPDESCSRRCWPPTPDPKSPLAYLHRRRLRRQRCAESRTAAPTSTSRSASASPRSSLPQDFPWEDLPSAELDLPSTHSVSAFPLTAQVQRGHRARHRDRHLAHRLRLRRRLPAPRRASPAPAPRSHLRRSALRPAGAHLRHRRATHRVSSR